MSEFVHGNALIRHAGLHLADARSEKWKGQMVLFKHGRSACGSTSSLRP
ncbi:hypothetical protein ABS315_00605 [Peribacillus frigoritolerans]